MDHSKPNPDTYKRYKELTGINPSDEFFVSAKSSMEEVTRKWESDDAVELLDSLIFPYCIKVTTSSGDGYIRCGTYISKFYGGSGPDFQISTDGKFGVSPVISARYDTLDIFELRRWATVIIMETEEVLRLARNEWGGDVIINKIISAIDEQTARLLVILETSDT